MGNTTKVGKPATGDRRLFASEQWERCYRDFLQSIREHSGSEDSAYQYERVLRRFFTVPNKRPDQYTRQDVEAFLHQLTDSPQKSGTPPAASTRNARLAILKSFYAFAGQYTVTFRGKPTPLMRVPAPTTGIKRGRPTEVYRAMSLEELKQLFSVIPQTVVGKRDRALFLFLFWSARRRQEVTRLLWGDLEPNYRFDDGHIGCLYTWRGKGRQRRPDSAELPPAAWKALEEYLRASGRWGYMVADDPLFPGLRTNDNLYAKKPIHRGSVTQIFHHYVVAAGLDGRGICLHSLRHTAAHERNEAGMDVIAVMELLRHSSLDTTWKYLKKMKKQADSGAQLLAAKFGNL